MIIIRNTTEEEIILCGTLFREVGEEDNSREIPDSGLSAWEESTDAFTHLISGAVVLNYYGNDVDANKAINILKGSLPTEVKVQEVPQSYPFNNKYLPDGKKLYRRKHGVKGTCSVGEETPIDFIIPYGHCKIDEVELIDSNTGDVADIMILDSDIGSYSGVPYLTLNQFGYDVNISEGYYSDSSNYEADLYLGMVVRVLYKNLGDTEANFGINLVLHEVK